MLFKAPVLNAIAEGQVTLAFRRWRKPTVRGGGTLTTPVGVLSIDAVEIAALETLDAIQAKRAGYASLEALLADLSGQAPLYRISFRLTAEDPRKALALDTSAAGLAAVEIALAKLDARTPWTTSTLDLIAAHPSVRAPDLAALQGRETPPFKTNVRKLKALGLTQSLEIGYRLSPRGEALLAARRSGG
ncbi:MAG: hypothetical protein Q7T84_07770 [Phenylobacterium sp.]|uniref:hypothetical protein n=1 Tax=Phenylobacterium sp. TaxID=1871053 RepID=UPI00271CE54B|nr:hypothetical protein [Phenylobacterium sp.]MDO9431185.1 hypothetical protein [Phenylobacterium sp.]